MAYQDVTHFKKRLHIDACEVSFLVLQRDAKMCYCIGLGALSIQRCLTSTGIPMWKIRLSRDRLIHTWKNGLYNGTGPRIRYIYRLLLHLEINTTVHVRWHCFQMWIFRRNICFLQISPNFLSIIVKFVGNGIWPWYPFEGPHRPYKLVSVSNTMYFHKIFLSLETPNREACQISQQLKNSKHQDYTNTSQFRCHIVC